MTRTLRPSATTRCRAAHTRNPSPRGSPTAASRSSLEALHSAVRWTSRRGPGGRDREPRESAGWAGREETRRSHSSLHGTDTATAPGSAKWSEREDLRTRIRRYFLASQSKLVKHGPAHCSRDLLLRPRHEVEVGRVDLKPVHASGDQPLDVLSGQFAITLPGVTKDVDRRKHTSTASIETTAISARKIPRPPEPEGTPQAVRNAPSWEILSSLVGASPVKQNTYV